MMDDAVRSGSVEWFNWERRVFQEVFLVVDSERLTVHPCDRTQKCITPPADLKEIVRLGRSDYELFGKADARSKKYYFGVENAVQGRTASRGYTAACTARCAPTRPNPCARLNVFRVRSHAAHQQWVRHLERIAWVGAAVEAEGLFPRPRNACVAAVADAVLAACGGDFVDCASPPRTTRRMSQSSYASPSPVSLPAAPPGDASTTDADAGGSALNYARGATNVSTASTSLRRTASQSPVVMEVTQSGDSRPVSRSPSRVRGEGGTTAPAGSSDAPPHGDVDDSIAVLLESHGRLPARGGGRADPGKPRRFVPTRARFSSASPTRAPRVATAPQPANAHPPLVRSATDDLLDALAHDYARTSDDNPSSSARAAPPPPPATSARATAKRRPATARPRTAAARPSSPPSARPSTRAAGASPTRGSASGAHTSRTQRRPAGPRPSAPASYGRLAPAAQRVPACARESSRTFVRPQPLPGAPGRLASSSPTGSSRHSPPAPHRRPVGDSALAKSHTFAAPTAAQRSRTAHTETQARPRNADSRTLASPTAQARRSRGARTMAFNPVIAAGESGSMRRPVAGADAPPGRPVAQAGTGGGVFHMHAPPPPSTLQALKGRGRRKSSRAEAAKSQATEPQTRVPVEVTAPMSPPRTEARRRRSVTPPPLGDAAMEREGSSGSGTRNAPLRSPIAGRDIQTYVSENLTPQKQDELENLDDQLATIMDEADQLNGGGVGSRASSPEQDHHAAVGGRPAPTNTNVA